MIGLGLIFLSCKDSPKEKIIKIVSDWQGKEIIFPKDILHVVAQIFCMIRGRFHRTLQQI